MIKRKGVKYLLYAYGKLQQEQDNIALLVVGSGPLESQLKELAISLKIKNVKFVNSGLSLEWLVKFFSAADVFVLPTREDIWGFVINEAMACGLPVIATRTSQAANEMVRQEENGYVIKEADVEGLYKALQKVIRDVELRERMAKRSREIVENEFNPTHMVDGFLLAIEYCTGNFRKEK